MFSGLWNLLTDNSTTTNNTNQGTTSKDTGYFSNGYQPNNINGSKLSKSGTTIGQTGLKGSKNMAGSLMNDQNIWVDTNGNYYIWVGMDGKSVANGLDGSEMHGYYQQVGSGGSLWNNLSSVNFSSPEYFGEYSKQPWYESQKNLWAKTTTSTNTNTSKPSTGTSSGAATVAAPAYDDSALRGQLAEQNKQIQDLLDQIYELQHPKVYTAQELAEHYDVADMYNVDYWNRLYDRATNDYFNRAVQEQDKLRTDYAYNNNLYVDNLMNDYLKSYRNAAPTAASRGAMAANALSINGLQGQINSESDYGMLQSINQLEEDRKAELAENKNSALQAYQNMGTFLMQLGADHNKSDVLDYTNTLNNLSTKYAASRQYSSALANANATRYAGLAQAAATNAQTAANSYNNSLYNQLYNMYSIYGGKQNTAYLSGMGW